MKNFFTQERLQDFGEKSKRTLHDIFTGDFLTREFITKQFGLLFLIGAMFLIYINAGYRSEKQHNKIIILQNQLQDLRYEYLTLSAELVEMSRQSNVSAQLKENGSQIKESSVPAIKIR